MTDPRRVVQGRGAVTNPQNRFERLVYERDPQAEVDETSPQTVFYRDPTRTILAKNDSPDVGFERSINPYRGCEHGCVYCFARPTHEYLGFSAGAESCTQHAGWKTLRPEVGNPTEGRGYLSGTGAGALHCVGPAGGHRRKVSATVGR